MTILLKLKSGLNIKKWDSILIQGKSLSYAEVSPYYFNPAGLPEGYPTHSYCVKEVVGGASRSIMFHVKNTGGANAKASDVQVLFNASSSSGGASSVAIRHIGALAMGQSQVVLVNVPENCYSQPFSGVCQFQIKLDVHQNVGEMNENNNNESSKCVGAAG